MASVPAVPVYSEWKVGGVPPPYSHPSSQGQQIANTAGLNPYFWVSLEAIGHRPFLKLASAAAVVPAVPVSSEWEEKSRFESKEQDRRIDPPQKEEARRE